MWDDEEEEEENRSNLKQTKRAARLCWSFQGASHGSGLRLGLGPGIEILKTIVFVSLVYTV